jgi:hypothetical protein
MTDQGGTSGSPISTLCATGWHYREPDYPHQCGGPGIVKWGPDGEGVHIRGCGCSCHDAQVAVLRDQLELRQMRGAA